MDHSKQTRKPLIMLSLKDFFGHLLFWLGFHDLFGPLSWHSGKESACQCRETKDSGLIPESGRSPEEGNSNPLQYSCLGNPTDRGAWWAIVHGVSESDTTEHACILYTQAHVLFLGNFSVGTTASGLRNGSIVQQSLVFQKNTLATRPEPTHDPQLNQVSQPFQTQPLLKRLELSSCQQRIF